MTFLVDTSVWSLALRRDVEVEEPEVHALKEALSGADVVVTTGLVLQELLQAGSGGLPLGLASTEGLAITGEAVQLWMARL